MQGGMGGGGMQGGMQGGGMQGGGMQGGMGMGGPMGGGMQGMGGMGMQGGMGMGGGMMPMAVQGPSPWHQAVKALFLHVTHIEPHCYQLGMQERPFGGVDHKMFEVQKGAKQTLMFHNRVVRINAKHGRNDPQRPSHLTASWSVF